MKKILILIFLISCISCKKADILEPLKPSSKKEFNIDSLYIVKDIKKKNPVKIRKNNRKRKYIIF